MSDVTRDVRDLANKTARHSLWLLLSFLVCLAVMTPSASAQDNAAITGSAFDPSGAAVANASIQITNVATGQVRQVTSNSAGVYVIPNVGVGVEFLDLAPEARWAIEQELGIPSE